MGFQYIGKSYIRPDAISKVTGKAIYLDDIRLPGMLYAAILRPEIAHARILSIDATQAEHLPGGSGNGAVVPAISATWLPPTSPEGSVQRGAQTLASVWA